MAQIVCLFCAFPYFVVGVTNKSNEINFSDIVNATITIAIVQSESQREGSATTLCRGTSKTAAGQVHYRQK